MCPSSDGNEVAADARDHLELCFLFFSMLQPLHHRQPFCEAEWTSIVLPKKYGNAQLLNVKLVNFQSSQKSSSTTHSDQNSFSRLTHVDLDYVKMFHLLLWKRVGLGSIRKLTLQQKEWRRGRRKQREWLRMDGSGVILRRNEIATRRMDERQQKCTETWARDEYFCKISGLFRNALTSREERSIFLIQCNVNQRSW